MLQSTHLTLTSSPSPFGTRRRTSCSVRWPQRPQSATSTASSSS
uniref:Uncharacterized protein n=1 Tax=uncultured marine microorganism HF4000_ANIW137P11 TaxID=455534 RepID=B3T541_9ZZZZ|nr:hypothetical protein ALOHA_HF4000ANIW137P11ctg1g12 [uncultured marine microorganism HF4000_ANIW137P11]